MESFIGYVGGTLAIWLTCFYLGIGRTWIVPMPGFFIAAGVLLVAVVACFTASLRIFENK